MMALKLITFDVTGTILKLREPVGHCYAKVGAMYGVEADPDALTKQFYTVFKKLLVDHPNFGESDIGWQEWWTQLVFTTFRNSLPGNFEIKQSVFDNISSKLIEVYQTKECWTLVEGTEDLLNKLRTKNIELGVISNYDPRLKNILIDLNVHKHFKFVLTSYDAKCQKPDPAIFKVVEDMNKDFKKHELLHIGDNPALDYLGAKNAGWNALLIAEDFSKLTERFPNIEANWVVKNINEIYTTLHNKSMVL